MYLNRSSYHRAATPIERVALFNAAGEIRIYREGAEWRVSHASDELTPIHMPLDDGFRTMGAALEWCRKSFPNMPVYRVSYGGEDNAPRRALYLESCPLSELPDKFATEYVGNDSDGTSQFAPVKMLSLDSQDIESALSDGRAAPGLRWHGIAPSDVTGTLEIPEIGANGQWEGVAALYVTESSRPFDLAAIYRRAF